MRVTMCYEESGKIPDPRTKLTHMPSFIFVGHRQTVQTQIRRRRTRRHCLLTECSIEI